MSQSSLNGRPAVGRRINSGIQSNAHGRNSSYFRRRLVNQQDAYTFSLRVAYLIYQLQPRAKRTQHVPAPVQATKSSSTSIHDLMKDFSLIRDSKSTRFPSKFMDVLIQRLQDVMVGKERSPEYTDASVKRTFATALNAFIEPRFKKQMEKDRRVEDLVLIFMSNATKELQKGKAPGDKSWQLMADRHVALFVRLVGRILKEQDWAKDRPELASRLTTLEQKLLANDQDLSSGDSQTIEVLVPLSNQVKDMPLVQIIARVFDKSLELVQSDINMHRTDWTPEAALKDIKTYQSLLQMNSPKTLRSDDFDVEEAYDAWKRGEAPDLSQMILAIVQAYPELARATSVHNQANFSLVPVKPDAMNSAPVDLSRQALAEPDNPYILHQPVDMSHMSPNGHPADSSAEDHTFTFIPPDPRAYYKAALSACLSYDLHDSQLQQSGPESALLSKQSTELLNELCLRWRIPFISRITLFLDVTREKFLNNEIGLDQLDKAFQFVKEPLPAKGKDPNVYSELLSDRTKWTMADFTLYQQVLNTLHTNLLRDLLEVLLKCYEPKAPSPGPLLLVIDEHIESDPYFSRSQTSQAEFSQALRNGLSDRARDMYRSFLEKKLPSDRESWEFFHIIELGKAVVNLASRIQKKYKRNPEIMGANPLVLLLQVMLPDFAQDARDIVSKIMEVARQRGQEPPIEDGFELYRELVKIRDIHSDALPDIPFAFKIEDMLQEFVWRWIRLTEEAISGWVDGAVAQDDFKVRCPEGEEPTEEQRHSVSVIDLFTSFNQSIERIVNLNWDNDLHYAKFMTAMSKIMGIGISRYCDLLSQKFIEEMDRLTPEQELAQNQSRQEKYWQMAKDAWNNKDRIEPFNFYPTSFVKLNDIEYATTHLDKIEKEMNVDGCVDVINQNTPPGMQRQKRLMKNVFTIKIVEAEDLMACDVNGLSDPYVVLVDELQNRLAKTRIIYSNLNPRWDETVDITTSGPLNVVATVWDWDTLGDHDYVGRTNIKLDPAHFSDFMPREYWLDLDTQGRLLLRVNMEGERDDIQFYFGKTFRTLKRTERDMTRNITDKLSSYISYVLSRRTLKTLLSKGISSQLSAVSGFFARNAIKVNVPSSAPQAPTAAQVEEALGPLFTYFDDNFAIMKETLTGASMTSVMSRLWKEVLSTVEALCVPPISDKPSNQKPLTQQELDIVFRWMQLLYEFFAAVDPDTGEPMGVPFNVLQSPKYFDLKNLNFFYFEGTDDLIRTSERMVSATSNGQQGARSPNRLSAPAQMGTFNGAGASLLAVPGAGRRSKSVLLSRNLGTMRRAKEEKRKEAQAEPSDDMILRILRMRPEAQRYLKDRSRQKERLAAAAAAEQIVKMSIKQGGGGRMVGNLTRR